MNKYYCLLFVVFIWSCNSSSVQKEEKLRQPKKSVVQKHRTSVALESNSIAKITNWKEYFSVNDDLKKFNSISANEALNNALKLSELVKFLKDSIRPKELRTLSFRTRVNVLENEALRLKDMTYISAITANEVNIQVDKILSAFSATNSKINAVYNQLEVEKDIDNPKVIKKKPVPKRKLKKSLY